jgi:hypothetical protein
MSRHHRLRHYVGLEHEATKLSRLLSEFRFGTAREVLESHVARPASVAAPVRISVATA